VPIFERGVFLKAILRPTEDALVVKAEEGRDTTTIVVGKASKSL